MTAVLHVQVAGVLRVCICHVTIPWQSPWCGSATGQILRQMDWSIFSSTKSCHKHLPTLSPKDPPAAYSDPTGLLIPLKGQNERLFQKHNRCTCILGPFSPTKQHITCPWTNNSHTLKLETLFICCTVFFSWKKCNSLKFKSHSVKACGA